jgi:hypothetical protein
MGAHYIIAHPVHLGPGGKAEVEQFFTVAMNWYEEYISRHAEDGAEGSLVSMHKFNVSWEMWEMHPHGSEVVLCTSESMILHQKNPDGARPVVTLGPGQYAINAPGTWHTADVEQERTAVFIITG